LVKSILGPKKLVGPEKWIGGSGIFVRSLSSGSVRRTIFCGVSRKFSFCEIRVVRLRWLKLFIMNR
jgi:hypothetical protein